VHRTPLYANAAALLATWSPPDVEQSALRDAYTRHLAEHDDALDRSCAHGHLTASTIVLDPDRTHVLLTLHPRIGRWVQMGGHIEPSDATIVDAARREAIEESGVPDLVLDPHPVELEIHPYDCPRGLPNRHLDVRFVAIAPDRTSHRISEESVDLRWFQIDALPDVEAGVQRLIERGRRR
jgi:8-oxo-dGTP pyrophosphatase MutT (NUDIX family)